MSLLWNEERLQLPDRQARGAKSNLATVGLSAGGRMTPNLEGSYGDASGGAVEHDRGSLNTADALPPDGDVKYSSASGILKRLPLPRHRRLAVTQGPLAASALEVLVRHRLPRVALRAMTRLPFWDSVTPIPELDDIAKRLSMSLIGALMDSVERHDPKVIGLLVPSEACQGQGSYLVAKLGWEHGARKKIRAEAACLKDLAHIDALRDHVPTLIASGTIGSAQFLVQSSFPRGSRACNSRFRGQAEEFLSCLASNKPGVYCDSAGYRDLETLMQENHFRLADSIEFSQTWSNVQAVFQMWNVPAAYVHRDFVPANCVLAGRKLFVYDWENAVPSGNPLQDYFHWHIHPNLRGPRIFEPKWIEQRLKDARDFAQRIYPYVDWNDRLTTALFIAYLADQILERRELSTPFRRAEHDLYLRLLQSVDAF